MKRLVWIAVWLAAVGAPQALAAFPAPNVETSAEHPLFLFAAPRAVNADAQTYASQIAQLWAQLPERLKPYSVLVLDRPAPSAVRAEFYRGVLSALQPTGVPVALCVAGTDPANTLPPELVEPLLAEFSSVKGVQAAGLSFNDYPPDAGALGSSPTALWLITISDTAARYGRFLAWEMTPLEWPRMMSQPTQRALYDKLTECNGYVFPLVSLRGQQCLAGLSAACGLWLEGAVSAWGVAPSTQWYADAGFVQPGLFGPTPDPLSMAPGLYRAMIFESAMLGASVFTFGAPEELWAGPYRKYWDEAVYPALTELLEFALIPRREMVARKARVACALVPARTPLEFHTNLVDMDGVYDEGRLIHGAYGMERAGQIPELIPNTGRHYIVPLLSVFAPGTKASAFARVVTAGTLPTADAWVSALDQYLTPDAAGLATACRVGRSLFVFNNRENVQEPQDYRVPDVPAPVRGLEAKRVEGGVLLTWTPRPEDLAFRVLRRAPGEATRTVIARDVDQPTFTDTAADPNAAYAYAVTAVTDAKEPLEGVLNFGETLALSMGESRVAEEAVVSPALTYGKGAPIAPAATAFPAAPWWPTFDGVPPEQMPVAQAIVARIEQWDAAFSREDLNAIMDLYAGEYEDAEGWRRQYVQRAYQWFFERYRACKMTRQLRRWDFGNLAKDGSVRATLYCRFTGVAVSDLTGHTGDFPAVFPLTESGEITLTFIGQEGTWRLTSTSPALPNFREILGASTGPFDRLTPGPDKQE